MPSASRLERRLRSRLSHLQAASLRRCLRPPAGIDLSSNDYLGLAKHPLLRERMAAAVATERCGSTGCPTESLFSMDGNRAPLAEYGALCRELGAGADRRGTHC